MKKLELKQMEVIEGGSCAPVLAAGAFVSAVGSLFFPPAATLSWTLIGVWIDKCAVD